LSILHLPGLEAENAPMTVPMHPHVLPLDPSRRTLIGSIMRSRSNTTTASTHPL
jgi:hypothetical protein